MTNKEINRESKRIFEGVLLPSWAFRSQEDQEDYGVDGEVEITTPEDKATGFIFKVQLKGTSVASYDGNGQLVYSEASVERFHYYISELRIPLVFVVCDITTSNCYWTRVQGNRLLETAHADAANKRQQTFTIKFPASRKFSKSVESTGQIVEAVEAASDSITLRALKAMSPASVRSIIGREPDIDATEKQFKLFADLATTESIRQLLQVKDFDAAIRKAAVLLESDQDSLDVRILGGISLAHAYRLSLTAQNLPEAGLEAAKLKLGIGSRMLDICRNTDGRIQLKRYVRIFVRAARMHIRARSALALVVSEHAQTLQGDTMAGPLTRVQRMEISSLVARDFLKLRNALCLLGSSGLHSVMPYALSEITESIFPYVSALRMLKRGDMAEAYIDALFDFLPFCAGVVRRFDNGDDIPELLKILGMRFVALSDPSVESSAQILLKRYKDSLEGTPAFEHLDQVINSLNDLINEVEVGSRAKSTPSMTELRAYYAQQAAELGIDLNDPNDEIASIVRLGLADLDPTRVLLNCQHMHVVTTSHGIPAEMLGLSTAGSKRITCLKHGHGVEGLSLDSAYDQFAKVWPWTRNRMCCETCPDKLAHPAGWEWSEEWGRQQHEKYKKLGKDSDLK